MNEDELSKMLEECKVEKYFVNHMRCLDTHEKRKKEGRGVLR